MDDLDRKICGIIQKNSRISNTALASQTGLAVSTANDRLRKLDANGSIRRWEARLDPIKAGAGLCCFVFLDMALDGEAEAVETLCGYDEVMELHHISGAHSYLMKLRVMDMSALHSFLTNNVKPLHAVQRTETVLSMDALKESSAVKVTSVSD